MFLVARGAIEPPTQGFSNLRAASAAASLICLTKILLLLTSLSCLLLLQHDGRIAGASSGGSAGLYRIFISNIMPVQVARFAKWTGH
jgi:hypothetical protein